MTRKRLFPIALLILIVLGLGIWYAFAPSHTPAPQPAITKLSQQNFSEFKSAFNHGAGNVRLVLLLSPT